MCRPVDRRHIQRMEDLTKVITNTIMSCALGFTLYIVSGKDKYIYTLVMTLIIITSGYDVFRVWRRS